MDKTDDYKLLKKHYSEKFAQLCRDLFPTILEEPGKLYEIISNLFAPNKFLYDDILGEGIINKFKNYIYKEYDKEKNEIEITTKTPEELFDEAGYILYECKTEADIQRFRKYYKRDDGKVPVYKEGTKPEKYDGEELCTFNGGRLKQCRVFFAVKKNVDEIKRKDFKNPQRQDEYGTSVLSIQFTRGAKNYLSIKNRYNHTVDNPDATFSNDLDNIVPGLTDAFIKKYNLNINIDKTNFEITNYVCANDGKLYKYNYEEYNTYYCIDNVVIKNFTPIRYDKAKYIVLETTILDLQNKRFICDDHFSKIVIEKIKQKVNNENGTREININDNIFITLDNLNRIVSYINPTVKKIEDKFLSKNTVLTHIELSKVEEIGTNFLYFNNSLDHIDLPNVKKIDGCFLFCNKLLTSIDLPNVIQIGYGFLKSNSALESINLPKVEEIGIKFLYNNNSLEHIELPNVKFIDDNFLFFNFKLNHIELPNVKHIGAFFLNYNDLLERIELPNVEKIGSGFLHYNTVLTSISFPKVEKIEDNFLFYNVALNRIELPRVGSIGDDFLFNNNALTSISLPNAKEIGDNFLTCNEELEYIELPNVKEIGDSFLYSNVSLESISLLNAKKIGEQFLFSDNSLTSIKLPNVEKIGSEFCERSSWCAIAISIDMPDSVIIGNQTIDNPSLYFYQRNRAKLLIKEKQ